jgi:hypothetical protein
MSEQYNNYLKNHKENVAKGYEYIRDNIPSLIIGAYDYETQICNLHDMSKTKSDEYDAYDLYFYGNNKSYAVVNDFRKAWLTHIHRNPHHWQHWVLINDDPNEGMIALDMPYNYILEMVCDWWAFSWSKGKLDEIFTWYDEHKDYMKLSDATRFAVEMILNRIMESLEEQRELA